MATIHVLVGIPGSGKSTYAKSLEKQKGYIIVSSDTVRNLHPDWEESLIFPEVYRLCSEYLKNGQDIIYDATNITPKVRKRLVTSLEPYNVKYDMIAYYFPIDYETCLKRVETRNEDKNERFFPLDILKSYSENIIAPSLEEGFKEIKVIEQSSLNETFNKLSKNLIINNLQGYAFYYEDERGKIESFQGYESIETKKKITIDSNFRLASVTKQFIGYAIYKLIKEGKLDYNTYINDVLYLGEYAKDIKIINLLNHTSGLKNYEAMEHTDEQISDYDVLEYLRKQDSLYFEVGSKYQYSNSAYVLLGLVVSVVSKRNLDDYIENEIFKKVNMNDSKVNYQGVTQVDNRSYGHILQDNELIFKDQYWCSATIGDGGLYSSVKDLKKWLDYLFNIYNEETDFFKSNILSDGTDTEYCLGVRHIIRKGVDVIYHCGETIGTNTVIGFIPKQNKKFIFLTNIDNVQGSTFIENLIKLL